MPLMSSLSHFDQEQPASNTQSLWSENQLEFLQQDRFDFPNSLLFLFTMCIVQGPSAPQEVGVLQEKKKGRDLISFCFSHWEDVNMLWNTQV